MTPNEINEIRERYEVAVKYAVNKGKDVFLDNCLQDIPQLLNALEAETKRADEAERLAKRNHDSFVSLEEEFIKQGVSLRAVRDQLKAALEAATIRADKAEARLKEDCHYCDYIKCNPSDVEVLLKSNKHLEADRDQWKSRAEEYKRALLATGYVEAWESLEYLRKQRDQWKAKYEALKAKLDYATKRTEKPCGLCKHFNQKRYHEPCMSCETLMIHWKFDVERFAEGAK